jgi:hypothetical protein
MGIAHNSTDCGFFNLDITSGIRKKIMLHERLGED